MSETVEECEVRIGRKLTDSEREYKTHLRSMCTCGHDGNAHSAPLLGGPAGFPCWAEGCPCYSFPEGSTKEEKDRG